MLLVQGVAQGSQSVFADIKEFAELVATVIGGFCALKGISYIDSLRKKKMLSTFSFESQLFARIYEIYTLISGDDRFFTNLYSNEAYKEWNDKSGVTKEELDSLYNNAKETLEFIKNTPDQLPAYASWGNDYRELIKNLVDILHYDIRSSQKGFKFTASCPMDDRKKYCDSFLKLLERMMDGISFDQNATANGLF